MYASLCTKVSILFAMLWVLFAPCLSFAQVQGGNGNPNPGPQGNQVIFYRDIKYTGMSRSFSPGNFTSGSLGFLSGNISSIYIPRGWSVTARSRNGRSQTFTTSNPMLASLGWDNQIISGAIKMNQSGGPGGGSGNRPVVRLFYDLDFTGNMVQFGPGSFKFLGMNVAENITSFTVAPGYAVQVFRKPNLKGRSQIFTTSINDLRRVGWDNQVASIRVSRVN
ncbi:hypothetical protein [Spirosoma pulveris]